MKMNLEKCPTCGEQLDAATPIDGEATPTEGDLSICLYCGEIMEFAEGMKLVKADIESIVTADFIELQKAQKIVRAFKER